MARRRLKPPERRCTGTSACERSSRKSISSSTRRDSAGLAQQMIAAEDAQVLDRRERLDEHVLLQRDAEPSRAPRADRCAMSMPKTRIVTGGRPADAVDHAQRRRLAGAVRAEQAEADAGRDVEVDAVDRHPLAEALHDAAGFNDHRLAIARRPNRSRYGRARRLRRGAVTAAGSAQQCRVFRPKSR